MELPVTVAQTISDSISWEAAQQVMRYQTVLLYFILALFGVVVVVLGWLTPRRINTKLDEAIQSAKSEAQDKTQQVIHEFEKKMGTKLSEIDDKIALREFDGARTFAIMNSNNKMWLLSAFWWLTTLSIGMKIRDAKSLGVFNEELLSTATEFALENLDKVQDLKLIDSEIERIGDMKDLAKEIPELLGKRKKQIQRKLNELEKRT